MIPSKLQYRGLAYHSQIPISQALETGESLKYRGVYHPQRRVLICTQALLGQRLVYRGLAY